MTAQNGLVSPASFQSFVSGRIGALVSLSRSVERGGGGSRCFTRPVLHGLLWAASEVEELLDSYGAGRNLRWCRLRRLVATVKLFSAVAYGLKHVKLFLPAYRLVPLEQDFVEATRLALEGICEMLARPIEALLLEAVELGIAGGRESVEQEQPEEMPPPGRLAADRSSRRVASPEQTVASLATAFLNLAEDSAFIHITQEPGPDRHAGWIPDPINEARLRDLEQRFHSLQSLYDTYISDTNVESLDPELPVLRGQVTVVYHLLQIATMLTHFCERHIPTFVPPGEPAGSSGEPSAPSGQVEVPVLDPDRVLEVLMDYSLAFSSRYIVATRSLCHEMLRRYAIQGHVSVPIPRYRGFHVRPSTLVARVVAHYGSEATMTLEEESYNAGYTLDLFRANEKINAVKRRLLAQEVHRSLSESPLPPDEEPEAAVRLVARRLYAQGRLMLYERNLSLEGFNRRGCEPPEEQVTRALTWMLTMGKIDVDMEVTVSFFGDRRVLEDIKLLADSRYGEDDFGNNLPLPAKLAYLRK